MQVDFAAIVDQLEGDPGFRARLRAVILSDELLELPERVARLEERVARLEERVARLEERVAEMDARLTARLDALTARLDALTARLDAFAEQVDRRFEEVDRRFEEASVERGKLRDDIGVLKGRDFEARIAAHPGRYLSDLLVRPVARDVETFDLSPLSGEDRRQLVRADLVVAGRATETPSSETELLAVVEASWRVHVDDLQRAVDRAAILARVAGGPVLPVAVSKVDPGEAIVERAAELGLALLVDDGGPPRTTGRLRAAA